MGVARCATASRAPPGMGEVIPERRNQAHSLSLHKAIANKLYDQLTTTPPPDRPREHPSNQPVGAVMVGKRASVARRTTIPSASAVHHFEPVAGLTALVSGRIV